jgi:hypothetical protein
VNTDECRVAGVFFIACCEDDEACRCALSAVRDYGGYSGISYDIGYLDSFKQITADGVQSYAGNQLAQIIRALNLISKGLSVASGYFTLKYEYDLAFVRQLA